MLGNQGQLGSGLLRGRCPQHWLAPCPKEGSRPRTSPNWNSPTWSSSGLVDSQNLPSRIAEIPQGFIYPARLSREIEVESADDNAGVSGHFTMQPEEVLAIQRHDRSSLASRERENLRIRPRLVGETSRAHGQDIVAQPRKLHDDRLGQILVRKQTSQDLRCLVLANLFFDEVSVAVDEGPSRREVIGAERRVRTKEVWLASALPSRLFQEPHWNPRAHDARRAPADIRTRLDARERIAKLTRDLAQQLSLLCGRQTGDQSLGFLESRHGFRLPRA
jgi:hypothetical protein